MVKGYPDWQRAINIAAQDLNKVDIDVISQTISELTQRSKLGAVRNSQTIKTIPAGSETTVFSLTGKGYFIYALFVLDNDELAINLKFDNPSAYWGVSPQNLYSYGFGSGTPFMGLGTYTAGGASVMYIAPLMPMSFETSFEITILNPKISDYTAFVGLYYAVL